MALVALGAGVLGLFVGSFLNVCIWRLPREEQVIRGRSHCPACGHVIRWYDNIPLASFVLLRRRCRDCGAPIPWRYPAVELLTGIAVALVIARWGLTGQALVYAVLVCALIAVSFIDAKEQIIPDVISLPGIVLGLAASVAWPVLHGSDCRPCALWESVRGAALGSGAIYLMGVIGRWIFKKEAMGLGDVKLMAMLGAVLGWQRILFTFFLAPVLGSLVGVPLKLLRGAEIIPYGPYLSVAALVALWWGDGLIAWYFQSVGGL